MTYVSQGLYARGIWQRPYRRVHQTGELILVNGARTYTAEDYDLLEKLTSLGLPTSEIRRYFTPMPTANAIRCALLRADIPLTKTRGRPTNAERVKWAEIYKRWKAGEQL